MPKVSTSTAFAGVIGWHTISSSAVSVVKMGNPLGGALPFYVLSGVTGGTQICVINAPPGKSLPCADQTGGSFGAYAPWYYNWECQDGANTASGNFYSTAPAIAEGLDHYLSPYSDFTTDTGLMHQRVNGGNSCTVTAPNTVDLTQGNLNQIIVQALVSGNAQGNRSYTGRLAGGPFAGGGNNGDLNDAIFTKSGATIHINNAPLWYFLDKNIDGNNAYPYECWAATRLSPKRDVALTQLVNVQNQLGLIIGGAPAYSTPERLMSGCVQKWTVADGKLFTKAIGTTMRLGSVPRFWETTLLTRDHIRDFVPLFLESEIIKNSSDATGTDLTQTHWAGGVTPPGSWKNIDLTSEGGMFVPCLSLPSTLCASISNDPNDNGLGGVLGGVTTIQ